MAMLRDFREFALKGDVVDLAVGVVIGAAFGKIVASLVEDVVMPVVGFLAGGGSFTEHRLVLRAAAAGAPEVALRYGAFVSTIVNFVIVAAAVFVAVKALQRARRAAPVLD